MAFTTVTVVGTFEDATGKPANGRLTATPSHPLTNGEDIVTTKPVVGQIVNGVLTNFKIKASNDPETIPTEAFYKFRLETFSGQPCVFNAVVPFEETTVDFATLARSSREFAVSGSTKEAPPGPRGPQGPPGPPGAGLTIDAKQGEGPAEGTESVTVAAFVEPISRDMLIGIWASAIAYFKPSGEATSTGYRLQLILNTGEGKYTAAESSGGELGTFPGRRILNNTTGWGFPENGQDMGKPIFEALTKELPFEGEIRLVNTEPSNGSVVLEKSVINVREL